MVSAARVLLILGAIAVAANTGVRRAAPTAYVAITIRAIAIVTGTAITAIGRPSAGPNERLSRQRRAVMSR
jgi:hypothetical protein